MHAKGRPSETALIIHEKIIFIYFNNYEFLNITSRILFIEIVNILKKTKNSPNQPRITAIDNKLEPRSP